MNGKLWNNYLRINLCLSQQKGHRPSGYKRHIKAQETTGAAPDVQGRVGTAVQGSLNQLYQGAARCSNVWQHVKDKIKEHNAQEEQTSAR